MMQIRKKEEEKRAAEGNTRPMSVLFDDEFSIKNKTQLNLEPVEQHPLAAEQPSMDNN